MPKITVIQIAVVTGTLIIGIILGWVFRGKRSVSEKISINSGWQEQLAAQRNEHERLLEQNKSLMEQNSQYQASNKDSKMRASELSGALKEAFERRDELQRQIKDIRSNLETAVVEREQLQNDIQSRAAADDATSTALKRRDEKIAQLSSELDSWQERVAPLIERFRERNEEAYELEAQLAAARERITALEQAADAGQTRIEPVDGDTLRDSLDASNDPHDAVDDDIEVVEEAADDEDADELLAADELEEILEADELEEILEADAADDSDYAEIRDIESARAAADSDSNDDLKMIKGIGPAIEKTLNEMGIYRFNQIAEMSEYEIERIANKLKGFHSRIYREDWIGQARHLQDQKSSYQA